MVFPKEKWIVGESRNVQSFAEIFFQFVEIFIVFIADITSFEIGAEFFLFLGDRLIEAIIRRKRRRIRSRIVPIDSSHHLTNERLADALVVIVGLFQMSILGMQHVRRIMDRLNFEHLSDQIG